MKGKWWESQTRIREDRVAVKLVDDAGAFKKSVLIPTAYYPLNGKFRVFNNQNTRRLADPEVAEIFNSIPYRIGFCYQNTQMLTDALTAKGYDAHSYVGWLFTADSECPIHHCWCVLENDIVLDLSDDYTLMLSGQNGENFKGKSKEEAQELLADFREAARNVPNSIRCSPVGIPTSIFYYVGSECDPEQGRRIYNMLVAEYPDHECQRNCNRDGINQTQAILKARGLM